MSVRRIHETTVRGVRVLLRAVLSSNSQGHSRNIKRFPYFSLFRTDLHKSHGNRDRARENPRNRALTGLSGAAPSEERSGGKRQNAATRATTCATTMAVEEAGRAERQSSPRGMVEETALIIEHSFSVDEVEEFGDECSLLWQWGTRAARSPV